MVHCPRGGASAGLESRDANQLHAQAARESAARRGRPHSAPLRALRPVHGHLLDLRAGGRRARLSARSHLPDEGHVRERPRCRRRGAPSHRPLSLLPVLHDHVPERRRLHAPGGSRPSAHRGYRAAQPQGPAAAVVARQSHSLSRSFRPRAGAGTAGAAVQRCVEALRIEGAGRHAGYGAAQARARREIHRAGHGGDQDGAAQARPLARRLRAAGAAA